MTDFVWNKIDYGNVLIRALEKIIDSKVPILETGKELALLRGYLAHRQMVFDNVKHQKKRFEGFEHGQPSIIYQHKIKNYRR